MTSRLLASMDAEIAGATNKVAADCHRARRASYLVRIGQVEEARSSVATLRERYRLAPQAEVSARVNLAEGLAYFFGGESDAALDKIRRAHALATAAASIPHVRALCAAWLAHLEFGLLRIREMTSRLQEAFEYSESTNHEALSRASLVAAVALHSSNRYDLAKPWYSKARLHAVAEGDDATMSALLHNMTSMGVMNLRQAVLTRAGESRLALDALMGADSTSSYDSLKGMLGLSTWVPLLRAYVASLVGDPAQALALYRDHSSDAAQQGQGRMMPYVRADVAWCQAQIGDLDLARSEAADAERTLSRDVHVDDRAATHSRLSLTFTSLGCVDIAAKHELLAVDTWKEYVLLQSRTVDSLARLASLVRGPSP